MKALFCGIYVIASDAKSVLLTLSRESTKHWIYNEETKDMQTVDGSNFVCPKLKYKIQEVREAPRKQSGCPPPSKRTLCGNYFRRKSVNLFETAILTLESIFSASLWLFLTFSDSL